MPSRPLRFALLWLGGIDLRITMLAIPPVIPLIHRDLRLDETTVGALGTMPVLLLGVAAIPGSLLIARVGARRAVIAGLFLVAVGSALRGALPSVAFLFAMTFAMGLGVAVMQPAFPSLVARWFPQAIGLGTATYANGLLVGEILSASLTLPFILPLVGGSWQWSLAFWALPVLLTLALFAFATAHQPPAHDAPPARWWPDWHDPRVWRFGLMQAGTSALYFGANSFMPDYLRTFGMSSLIGPVLTSLNAAQLPASFLLVAIAPRIVGHGWPLALAAVAGLASLALFLTNLPAAMIAGAALLGFCGAFILILMLALPPIFTESHDVHRLSAAVFAIGYALSFVASLYGGVLWDHTHTAATAFIPAAAGCTLLFALSIGLRPPRPATA